MGAGQALGKSGERAAAALLDNLSTDSLDFKVLASPKKQVLQCQLASTARSRHGALPGLGILILLRIGSVTFHTFVPVALLQFPMGTQVLL